MNRVIVLSILCFLQFSCKEKPKTEQQVDVRPRTANYSEAQLKEADSSRVPMSMVRNVRQAKNGDILVASYLGVFRYDGTSFTNITSAVIAPRVSSFWDVLEDRRGNLWFGSKDSGVYYYDGISFQHFTTKDGLANNRIVKIYEDKAGNIWFATGGGASRYDGKSFRNFTKEDGLSNNDLTTIMEDRTGRLWFGTRGDACYFDGKTFTVLRNKEGEAFYNVWGIAEDRKGHIWIGGSIVKKKEGSTLYLDHGLWRYDGSTMSKVSQRGAYSIMEDSKGNIWTSGEVRPQVWALSRYDAGSLYNKMPTVTEVKSGRGMDFLGILQAGDGSIWYGSGSGVHRYDGKTFTDFARKEGSN